MYAKIRRFNIVKSGMMVTNDGITVSVMIVGALRFDTLQPCSLAGVDG